MSACPECGHDPDAPEPETPPKQPSCPVHGDTCLVCTVTVYLDGDIDALTEQLRQRRDIRP